MAPTRSAATKSSQRRGKSPRARIKDTSTKKTTKPRHPKTSATRKKAAHNDTEDELSILSTDQQQATKVHKRKAHDTGNAIAGAHLASRNSYEQLKARTKRIPQEQIESWPQVSPPILEQVITVIRDAKKDIANAQRDERKVIAAHNTLNPLVKKLSRHLESSRIPPQAKDVHFNIGKLTERSTQVSREVTTARHAKQLLTEQTKITQSLLNKDKKNLEQLKRDTKKWRTEWRHQEKRGRIHPFLQHEEEKGGKCDRPDDINLQQSSPPNLTLLEMPDAELSPILAQLRRSLDNMQGNHAQVQGIVEAIQQTEVELDHVLFKHASSSQYAAFSAGKS